MSMKFWCVAFTLGRRFRVAVKRSFTSRGKQFWFYLCSPWVENIGVCPVLPQHFSQKSTPAMTNFSTSLPQFIANCWCTIGLCPSDFSLSKTLHCLEENCQLWQMFWFSIECSLSCSFRRLPKYHFVVIIGIFLIVFGGLLFLKLPQRLLNNKTAAALKSFVLAAQMYL